MGREVDGSPRVNTSSINLQDYQALRLEFFKRYMEFKMGLVESGIYAANLLTCMYQVLPSARHISADPEKSLAFVNKIDSLRRDLADYTSKNQTNAKVIMIGPSKSYLLLESFRALDDRFDEIFQELQMIMFELGYET